MQLELLSETRPVPPLADRAIREGIDLLSRHLYLELGRALGSRLPGPGKSPALSARISIRIRREPIGAISIAQLRRPRIPTIFQT